MDIPKDGYIHFVAQKLELIFALYLTHRELLYTADGGQLAIDWVHNDDSPHSHEVRPTVLILPGLTGNSSSCDLKCTQFSYIN